MLITVLRGYASVRKSSVEPDNKADAKNPIDEMAQTGHYVRSSLSKESHQGNSFSKTKKKLFPT